MNRKRIGLRGSVALAAVAVGAGGMMPAASATPANSGVHNGVIAFSGGPGWVEVNPDGSDDGGYHLVSVAPDVLRHGSIAFGGFSPDGSKATFTAGCAVWVSNADGSGAVQLTHPNGSICDANPTFSANGGTVFFSRGLSVMSIPVDGSAAEQPIPGIGKLRDGSSAFAVSPDGTRLAYETQGATGPVLAIADLTKGGVQTGAIPFGAQPTFSPDGSHLVVVSYQTGSPVTEIHSVAADGSIEATGRTLAGAVARNVNTGAVFSPDGTQLAFYGHGIRIVSVATGQLLTELEEPGGTGLGTLAWQNGPMYTGRLTPPAPASEVGAVVRFGGADRIGTAISAAKAAYGPEMGMHAQIVVLSRDDNYADALAGNALAAQKHGPLLLTGSDLDPRVADTITGILPKGSTVYLLGGESALRTTVSDKIRSLGYTPKRLGGNDRFQTAVAIAKEISPAPHTVMVATGKDYPDALTAGAAAAHDAAGGVVMLSDGRDLPTVTREYLKGLNPGSTDVYGVGGPGVTAAASVFGAAKVTPLAGADRFATALAVAKSGFFSPFGVVSVATGQTWPDALSGGALSGTLSAPVLLADTNGLTPDELRWLGDAHPYGNLVALFAFGGTQVLPRPVLEAAADAAFHGRDHWKPFDPPAFSWFGMYSKF